MASSGEDVEQPFLSSYPRREDDESRKGRIPICLLLLIGILFLGCYFLKIMGDIYTGYPEIQIDSAMVSLSPKNPNSSDYASANWTIGISVTNPNKHGTISYDAFGVSVFQNSSHKYNDDNIPYEATITPFSQNPGGQTAVTAAGSEGLISMVVDIRNSSRIRLPFNVKMQMQLGYDCPVCLKSLSSFILEFKCMDIIVALANANESRMDGEPRKCSLIDWRE